MLPPLVLLSYHHLSSLILSHPFLFSLIVSYPILLSLILSYSILPSLLSSFILPYPLLSSLILSYQLISSLILPYPLLSSFILFPNSSTLQGCKAEISSSLKANLWVVGIIIGILLFLEVRQEITFSIFNRLQVFKSSTLSGFYSFPGILLHNIQPSTTHSLFNSRVISTQCLLSE